MSLLRLGQILTCIRSIYSPHRQILINTPHLGLRGTGSDHAGLEHRKSLCLAFFAAGGRPAVSTPAQVPDGAQGLPQTAMGGLQLPSGPELRMASGLEERLLVDANMFLMLAPLLLPPRRRLKAMWDWPLAWSLQLAYARFLERHLCSAPM